MNSTPVKGVLDRRFESAFQNAASAAKPMEDCEWTTEEIYMYVEK